VWQKIAADIFTLDGKDYIAVIDYYSNFPEFVRLESKTASAVITHLISLFARYGKHEILMSDNMPFNSKSFLDFADDWNFDLVWSNPGILSLTGWWSMLYRQSRCYSRNPSQKAKIHTLLFYSIDVLLWQVHHAVLLSC